jgi:hypothetical protein
MNPDDFGAVVPEREQPAAPIGPLVDKVRDIHAAINDLAHAMQPLVRSLREPEQVLAMAQVTLAVAALQGRTAAASDLVIGRARSLGSALEESLPEHADEAVALIAARVALQDHAATNSDHENFQRLLIDLRRRGEFDAAYPHLVIEALCELNIDLLTLAAAFRATDIDAPLDATRLRPVLQQLLHLRRTRDHGDAG